MLASMKKVDSVSFRPLAHATASTLSGCTRNSSPATIAAQRLRDKTQAIQATSMALPACSRRLVM